jgi:hypothetical protein
MFEHVRTCYVRLGYVTSGEGRLGHVRTGYAMLVRVRIFEAWTGQVISGHVRLC